jgi:hypothetical protein
LSDLKANVIIGRLLPIGQEFVARQERDAFDLGMTHDQTTITDSTQTQ